MSGWEFQKRLVSTVLSAKSWNNIVTKTRTDIKHRNQRRPSRSPVDDKGTDEHIGHRCTLVLYFTCHRRLEGHPFDALATFAEHGVLNWVARVESICRAGFRFKRRDAFDFEAALAHCMVFPIVTSHCMVFPIVTSQSTSRARFLQWDFRSRHKRNECCEVS